MTDSKYLHREAANIRRKMHYKLEAADSSDRRVAAYTKAGNFRKAHSESEIAIKYYQDALAMEYEAMKYDNEAADQEKKASDIDRQESEIKDKCTSQIEQLERQKRALLG